MKRVMNRKVKKNPSEPSTTILTPLMSKLFSRLSHLPPQTQNSYAKSILDSIEFDELLENNIHAFDELKKKALKQYREGTLTDL